MIRAQLLVSIAFLVGLPVAANAALFGEDPAPCASGTGASYEMGFSISGKMSELVIKNIASAKKTIRIAARTIASKEISEALVQASRSGRDVKIVLDSKLNNSGSSGAAFLRAMSLVPHVVTKYDGLYSNYLVIDENDLMLGNVVGLEDADVEKKNPADVLVIHNAPELAKQYLANWQVLWDESTEMKKAKSGGLHDAL